jgi:membrane protein required for colicin V production
MQPADWVILAIIGLSIVFGLMRGLVRESFSLAGWLAALIIARTFFSPFDALLASSISTPSLRHAMAYGGLFVGTLLVAWLLGFAIMSLVDAAGLKWSDRLLGAVFGLGRGLILVLSLLILLEPFVQQDPWWHSAKLPPVFMKYAFFGRQLRADVMHVALPPAGQRPDLALDPATLADHPELLRQLRAASGQERRPEK